MKLVDVIQAAKNLCPTDRNFLQLIRFSRSTESGHNHYICFAGDNGDSAYVVQLEDVGKLSERIVNHFPWMPTTEALTATDWIFTQSCCRIARGFVASIEIIRPSQAQGLPISMISTETYNELKQVCERYAKEYGGTNDVQQDIDQETIKRLALCLVFGKNANTIFPEQTLEGKLKWSAHIPE